jgi:sugar transferase (PEP-CTERM/EpsH1 system associated)
MTPIKIAYIVASLGYGGVEKYVVDIVNNINKKKFSPTVFTFKKDGPLKKLINPDVKIHEIEKKNGNSLLFPLRLGRLLKEDSISIVHSNNWSTFGEATIAASVARVPTMIHAQHGIEMNDAEAYVKSKRFIRNRLRQGFSQLTDRIVVVSQATKNFVCNEWKTPECKVQLLYNGIDIDTFSPRSNKEYNSLRTKLNIEQKQTVIGCTGRLMTVKNFPFLIRAFHKISSSFPDSILLLIGDGPERKNIESLTAKCNLNDRIILAGHRDDIKDLLHVLDIFVLPSISEGVSLALLEAMASGLPIIASNVGGNPEVIENNKSGLLVRSNDHDHLAELLSLLLNDEGRREQLGNAARKRVEGKFDKANMMKNYEQLYLSVV